MKKVILLTLMFVLLTAVAFAAESKSRRVTGPVLEVTDNVIVIKKGKGKWELDRNADTKVTGDLKVGEKVTIEYTMTAVDVVVKANKKKSTAKK